MSLSTLFDAAQIVEGEEAFSDFSQSLKDKEAALIQRFRNVADAAPTPFERRPWASEQYTPLTYIRGAGKEEDSGLFLEFGLYRTTRLRHLHGRVKIVYPWEEDFGETNIFKFPSVHITFPIEDVDYDTGTRFSEAFSYDHRAVQVREFTPHERAFAKKVSRYFHTKAIILIERNSDLLFYFIYNAHLRRRPTMHLPGYFPFVDTKKRTEDLDGHNGEGP